MRREGLRRKSADKPALAALGLRAKHEREELERRRMAEERKEDGELIAGWWNV